MALYEVSQTSSRIDLIELQTLKTLHRVGENVELGRILSFHYSMLNSVLACSEYHGTVLKFHDVDKDLKDLSSMTVVESVETNNYSPLVEHSARNLLFQGGIEEVAIIELESKQVIGRVLLQGIVKALRTSPDAASLHIMSKDYDSQAKKFNNYFYKLHFTRSDYRCVSTEVETVGQVTAMCLDVTNADTMIIAHCDGFKVSYMDTSQPLESVDEGHKICLLTQSPADQLLTESSGVYIFILDKEDQLWRVDRQT